MYLVHSNELLLPGNAAQTFWSFLPATSVQISRSYPNVLVQPLSATSDFTKGGEAPVEK